ncbi:MAG TPA: gamma-glutamyltransferase [Pusillimonas sp.]|uniref:gamma-glutamyltransferase n=1 Tax=unclassified Pusillimonas TaxID=2640016 RepID=UPI002627F3ED|nr:MULTISPECIES: gamma-glutamyltransferase [unclassified Pusillimonas]HLU18496.1 gamma-glutamyltransferase [Pusillimonas sp.]
MSQTQNTFDPSLPYGSRRPVVCAANIVATSQPLAAQAGLHMLQNGGNAVDAALAAAIALTVVEPTGTGVGGDAFAIVWDGAALHGLNSSGYSPAAWNRDVFAGMDQMPARGWASVTVPGAVAAWHELSHRMGRLPFERLFEPAINYGRAGFAVSPIISRLWATIAPKYKDQPGYRDYFMPQGRTPAPGELFRNPDLADSLQQIAATNGDAFYRGQLAEALLTHCDANGGLMSHDDLAQFKPEWCGTIQHSFAGAEIHEIPPNTQGLAALIALGILEHFDLARYGPDSLPTTHLSIEAMKLAFADLHAHVSDPTSMAVPAQSLLDPEYLKSRAELIDPDRAGDFGPGAPSQGGTVYVAAADDSGMMVSFIQSNYEGFGSGVVVPGTGISLQNRGMGFSLQPGHPNEVGPRKRPFHTIIPGFAMRNGQPLMTFGVMGGPMQAQGHVQMVLRVQLFGQNPQAACDAPRWQVVNGRRVMVEPAMSPDVIQKLSDMGHDITTDRGEAAFSFGGAQIIKRTAHGYVAGSDPRKDGLAIGF